MINATSQSDKPHDPSYDQPQGSNLSSRVFGVARDLIKALRNRPISFGTAALAITAGYAGTRMYPAKNSVTAVRTFENPKPQGIEVLIADVTHAHRNAVAYVCQDNLEPGNGAEVLALEDIMPESMCDFADFIEGIANMDEPPEVLSISVAHTPAGIISHNFDNVINRLKEILGPDPSQWTPRQKQYASEQCNHLLDIHISQFNDENKCGEGFSRQKVMGAYKQAVESGVNIIFAAGNDYAVQQKLKQNNIHVNEDKLFHSQYFAQGESLPEGVIVVGGASADESGNTGIADYSSPNKALDVVAPANQVQFNKEGNRASGTSFAAPKVAAVVANMRAINPKLSPAEIESLLKQSASPVAGSKDRTGAGLVNPQKAYELTRATLA